MTPEEILDHYAEQQGWDDRSKIDLLLEYISNQSSNAAFEDFIQVHIDAENALKDFAQTTKETAQ